MARIGFLREGERMRWFMQKAREHDPQTWLEVENMVLQACMDVNLDPQFKDATDFRYEACRGGSPYAKARFISGARTHHISLSLAWKYPGRLIQIAVKYDEVQYRIVVGMCRIDPVLWAIRNDFNLIHGRGIRKPKDPETLEDRTPLGMDVIRAPRPRQPPIDEYPRQDSAKFRREESPYKPVRA